MAYYVPPVKWGAHVPRVPHHIAPMRVTRKQSQIHNQNHKNTRSLGGEK